MVILLLFSDKYPTEATSGGKGSFGLQFEGVQILVVEKAGAEGADVCSPKTAGASSQLQGQSHPLNSSSQQGTSSVSKGSQPSGTVPPAKDQVFKHTSQCRHALFQTKACTLFPRRRGGVPCLSGTVAWLAPLSVP